MDLDASVVPLDPAGKVSDEKQLVDFNNLKSDDGSAVHQGEIPSSRSRRLAMINVAVSVRSSGWVHRSTATDMRLDHRTCVTLNIPGQSLF